MNRVVKSSNKHPIERFYFPEPMKKPTTIIVTTKDMRYIKKRFLTIWGINRFINKIMKTGYITI